MKKISTNIFNFRFLPFLLLVFPSCQKDARNLYKESGTWEIQKAEKVLMKNETNVYDSTFSSVGYFTLYDNNATLTYHNNCIYHIDSSFYSIAITQIANGSTGLSPLDGECYWEPGTDESDTRVTIIAEESSIGYPVFLVFSINKTGRNTQDWTFIQTATDTLNNSLYFKEVLSVQRKSE